MSRLLFWDLQNVQELKIKHCGASTSITCGNYQWVQPVLGPVLSMNLVIAEGILMQGYVPVCLAQTRKLFFCEELAMSTSHFGKTFIKTREGAHYSVYLNTVSLYS